MAKPLRVCVVGCGRVSKSHIDGIREIPESVELAAVASRDPAKAGQFQRQYGIPKSYTDLRGALADPEIEAVVLCLPNHLHKDAAILSARAGKHVLVEKPMANNVPDAEAMAETAEKAGVTLMVGQSRRFYDAVLESKARLQAGAIGPLVSISAVLFGYVAEPPTEWWRSSKQTGGLMIPMWGSHIIDYALWMFAEPPRRVYCEAARINSSWEGEDEVALLIGFADRRFATIKMSWNTRLKEESAWEGKGKMLSSSDIRYERYIQGSSGTMHLDDETELSLNGAPIVQGSQSPSNFALQVRELAHAIREGRKPMASGREVIDVIRVQGAALRSAELGQVIRF